MSVIELSLSIITGFVMILAILYFADIRKYKNKNMQIRIASTFMVLGLLVCGISVALFMLVTGN